VDVILTKSETMMVAEFDLAGELKVMCDKCAEDLYWPVKCSDSLIYKFTDEMLDDEKVRCVPSTEHKIDFTEPIYEFAVLALPARRVHPKGKCNPSVLKAMDEYLMVPKTKKEPKAPPSPKEENDIDPRWDKLKGLKKK
jgi:uncharacterized metal-binding protein YceD (DUF177 family)